MIEPTAELFQLAERYWQRQLSLGETDRFNQLLRDDAVAQRWFLAQAAIQARWQWEFADRHAVSVVSPAPRPRRSARRWAVAASLAVASTLLIWFLWPTSNPSLATLGNVTGAQWSAGVQHQPGDALGSGRLRLEGGVAEVQFANGAVAILEGPSDLELIAVDHAFLHAGQLVLRVPPLAVGFRLETPQARLLDLGTEFGVRVGDVGDTFVQVYEGEVLASAKSLKNEQRLESGQAMLIDTQAQEMPFYPERFIRYLPGPDDRQGRGVFPYNLVRHDELHIVPAPKGMTIDGDLGDWDLSGQFHSACEPPYGDHYYVRGAMMYDNQCLYIGGHVGDPFPLRSTVSPDVQREHYGNGGSVAFRLSLDRVMGWPVRGEHRGKRKTLTAVDTNDKLVFLVLWYYQPENQPCMHIRYGMDLHDVRVNPPGYRGAFRPAADGYTFEYAIPWPLLHAAEDPPQGGDVLGATWLVHWSEREGRVWKGQLIDVVNPRETGWNFQRAATWGRAIYHRQGNLPPGTVKPLNE